jgi:hypothetical protein
MVTYADKSTREKAGTAAASLGSGTTRKSAYSFQDRRPHAVIQQKRMDAGEQLTPANRAVQMVTDKSAHYFKDSRPQATLQRKQVHALAGKQSQPSLQKKSNATGLPDQLKSGIENLSGYSMDDVKVHYNSAKPAQLQAHAYAQGTEIHIASGQEKHLPHEAWHVVQQKQGRVMRTMQLKGKINVNDDKGLEKEADVMGAKAMQLAGNIPEQRKALAVTSLRMNGALQRYLIVGDRVISQDGEIDETVNLIYNTARDDLRVPVPPSSSHFFRSLYMLDQWTNRADEMKAVLKEWIMAPRNAQGAIRERGSLHALTREYAAYIDMAVAIIGRADSQENIEKEELQAATVLDSETLRQELVGFIHTQLRDYLNNTQPAELNGTLMSLIEANAGRYLPHMQAGILTIKEIIDSPDEHSITMLITAIHDVTDILWTNDNTKQIVSIPAARKQSTVAVVHGDQLMMARAAYEDRDWRGASATPKEAAAPIEAARVLATPVSMGPSNTTGRMMMLAEAAGGDVRSRESIAWGLFAFWYKKYRRELTDIHRQHFVMDMAANFGVEYNPGAAVIPRRYIPIRERAREHARNGGTFDDFPGPEKQELTDASVKRLKEGGKLSRIEKESVAELEETVLERVRSAAMMQGASQRQLDDALLHWFDHIDEL